MQLKTIKILYWFVTIVFFGFLLVGAISELLRTQSSNELLISLGYPLYLSTILGVAKVIGFVAIIQWKWSTLKEWAYAGFTIDIIGATASNFFVSGTVAGLITSVFLIPLFLSYWLWKKVQH